MSKAVVFSLISCRGDVLNTSALDNWSTQYVHAANPSSKVLLLIVSRGHLGRVLKRGNNSKIPIS